MQKNNFIKNINEKIFLTTADNILYQISKKLVDEKDIKKYHKGENKISFTKDVSCKFEMWNDDEYVDFNDKSFMLIHTNYINLNDKINLIKNSNEKINKLNLLKSVLDSNNVNTDAFKGFEKRNVFKAIANKKKKTDYNWNMSSKLFLRDWNFSNFLSKDNIEFVNSILVYPHNLMLGENFYLCHDWISHIDVVHLSTMSSSTKYNLMEKCLFNLYKMENCSNMKNIDQVFLDFKTCEKIFNLSREFSDKLIFYPFMTDEYYLIDNGKKHELNNTLVNDIDEIIKNILTPELIDIIPWDICTITGGFLTSLALGMFRNGPSFESPDIDIVIAIENKDKVYEEFYEFIDMLVRDLIDKGFKCRRKNRDNLRSKFSIKLKNKTKIEIDFFTQRMDPLPIIGSFHLPCVKLSYTPDGGLKMLPSCLISLMSGYNIDIKSSSTLESITKYVERGFGLVVNNEEIEDKFLMNFKKSNVMKGKKLIDSQFHY